MLTRNEVLTIMGILSEALKRNPTQDPFEILAAKRVAKAEADARKNQAEADEYNKRTSYYKASDMQRYNTALAEYEYKKTHRVADAYGNYPPLSPPDWYNEFYTQPPTVEAWAAMSEKERNTPGLVPPPPKGR